jgi:hypothetical protein
MVHYVLLVWLSSLGPTSPGLPVMGVPPMDWEACKRAEQEYLRLTYVVRTRCEPRGNVERGRFVDLAEEFRRRQEGR